MLKDRIAPTLLISIGLSDEEGGGGLIVDQ